MFEQTGPFSAGFLFSRSISCKILKKTCKSAVLQSIHTTPQYDYTTMFSCEMVMSMFVCAVVCVIDRTTHQVALLVREYCSVVTLGCGVNALQNSRPVRMLQGFDLETEKPAENGRDCSKIDENSAKLTRKTQGI